MLSNRKLKMGKSSKTTFHSSRDSPKMCLESTLLVELEEMLVEWEVLRTVGLKARGNP